MLKYNYFCRVVKDCNTLPKHVAEAVSLFVFKQKLLITCVVVNYNCILSFLCMFGIIAPCMAYKACTLLSLLYMYYVFCVRNKDSNKQTNKHAHTVTYILYVKARYNWDKAVTVM